MNDTVEAPVNPDPMPMNSMRITMLLSEDGMDLTTRWSFGDEMDDETCDYYRGVLEGLTLALLTDEGQFLDVAEIGRAALNLHAAKLSTPKETPPQPEFEGLADNVILFPGNARRH